MKTGTTPTTTTPTSAGAHGPASQYGWSNGWDRAARRLELLEHFADPKTIRHLEELGVDRGWSCLEVAGGGGSIARWMCQRVGPTGRVVATDLDTRFLDALRFEQLEVRRHDIRKEPLPTGFDLVHTRALLMHLPEREQVLDALIGAVAPGGWLFVEDPDLHPMMSFGRPAYAATWRHFGSETSSVTGLVTDWGRRLPEILAGRGLVEVGAIAETRFFNGGSPFAEWVALTWQQAREQWELTPAQAAEVALAERELADPSLWFTLPSIVGAWGRKVARQ